MPGLPDNPYISPEPPLRRATFQSFIWALIRLAIVTQRHAPDSTFAYALTVLQHTAMYTEGDRLTALYAAHYELASYVHTLLADDGPLQVAPEPARCSSPTCVVNHESEAALLESAARGDVDAIANICKATVRGVKDLDPVNGNPVSREDALIFLFFGTLQRLQQVLAKRVLGDHPDPTLN